MPNTSVFKKKEEKIIESCKVNKDDLRELCSLLERKIEEAAELELQNFKQLDQTEEEFEENKEKLKNSFELKITVIGEKGEDLLGSVDEVFDSPNFPANVKSLYANSETIQKSNYNYYPRNKFEILLIFTKPSIFDFSVLPSDPTPNYSKFIVEGYDTTWVQGVYKEIDDFFSERKSSFNFIHKQSVYDIFIWVFAIPFAFWVVSKLSNTITGIFEDSGLIIQIAAYLYLFYLMLIGFRILFHYARWIWPLIEFDSGKQSARKHRAIISFITLSIIVMVIYDFIKSVVL